MISSYFCPEMGEMPKVEEFSLTREKILQICDRF